MEMSCEKLSLNDQINSISWSIIFNVSFSFIIHFNCISTVFICLFKNSFSLDIIKKNEFEFMSDYLGV